MNARAQIYLIIEYDWPPAPSTTPTSECWFYVQFEGGVPKAFASDQEAIAEARRVDMEFMLTEAYKYKAQLTEKSRDEAGNAIMEISWDLKEKFFEVDAAGQRVGEITISPVTTSTGLRRP